MGKMNKTKIWLVVTFLWLGAGGLLGADTINHQSEVDRVTLLNQITDAVATLGDSPQEKERTIRQRKISRRKARLRKEYQKNLAEQRRAQGGR